MGSNFLWLVLITLVSLKGWSCHGCLEQEKLALLHLKPLFNDPHLKLKSWKGNDSSDCCQWKRVKCNTTTGRVIGLFLSGVSHHILQLDDSLFLPFEELKSLDLSNNQIVGFFEDKGFQGQLSNLEFLDLSENKLNESILWSLGGFLSIMSLNLEANAFTGKGIEQISRMTSLATLNLGFNRLNYSILSYLGGLPSLKTLILDGGVFKGRIYPEDQLSLKNLESLLIDGSFIRKSFLQSIGSMTSLKVLSLSLCELNGALPTKGLCELTHLKELDISYNNFSGYLPWCFSNLTSLEFLDLSYNQFSGNISLSPFQSLTSIRYLFLSDNQFQIPSSLRPFLNLSKLKIMYAENNQVYDDRGLYSSVPKFQLNNILLSCCGNGGALPKFLYHQHDLQHVDLSNINLSGYFPNWLLENNTGLQTLKLSNNSLSGPLQMPFQSHRNLYWLDLSQNHLDGCIDQEIGAYLPELVDLDISRNSFNGTIPSSFGDMKWLQFLDASNNNLSGEIPEHFAMGCYSLTQLILSNNHLKGQIFHSKSNWAFLGILRLDGNCFSGQIPHSMLRLNSSLMELGISDNYLSGTIPRWLGNLTNLKTILMGNNSFEGPIPIELCQLQSLAVLDLSRNNISGKLMSCSFPFMVEMHLSRNRLEGPLTNAICNNSLFLLALDLSDNYFTGKIPGCIDELQQLSFLLLSKNKFEGNIPTQLCRLNWLGMIDLSHNNLSGAIPACLNVICLDEVLRTKMGYVEFLNPTDFYLRPLGFTTKGSFYLYGGSILPYMSGIDLSSNRLVGKIPHEIGNLSEIRALNISHNRLAGSIPPTLSNLGLIESLDLSYNNLSGEIPPQLVELCSLAYFSVAYNNLSGKTPARVQQFATFEKSSYEGNPFLCGEPLRNNCLATRPEPVSEKTNNPTDVLYINPYWRRVWFYYIEMGYTSCYYFVCRWGYESRSPFAIVLEGLCNLTIPTLQEKVKIGVPSQGIPFEKCFGVVSEGICNLTIPKNSSNVIVKRPQPQFPLINSALAWECRPEAPATASGAQFKALFKVWELSKAILMFGEGGCVMAVGSRRNSVFCISNLYSTMISCWKVGEEMIVQIVVNGVVSSVTPGQAESSDSLLIIVLATFCISTSPYFFLLKN
ncbi:hypothetical protein SLEP1_g16292 [Rubroshorea leprosula]|uniref:Leucine-rich repeat-containing N-terminal plant-type domain-containing protein n=1 Tax=Rubroshorea leprosula TaxID=152421 RepID=A0AAV5IW16_9ROSI|nr:hypothetical protein SLEP1_g16292 [Rubroshorea leprosula]